MVIGLFQPVLDFLGLSLSDFLLIIIILLTLRRRERRK